MADKISDYHDNVRRDVFPFLPDHAGRVLDFGGGIGATSAQLKDDGRASSVVVADQVSETLPSVDLKVIANLDDVTAIETSIAPHGPFDTILCLDVLEHLRDPWSTLKLLTTMLVSGGTVVVSVPNVNYKGIVLPLLLDGSWKLEDQGPLDRTHLRWFTRDSLVDLVTKAGLSVDVVEGTVGGRNAVIDAATFGIFNRFFAVQYITRGTKT